MQLPLTQQLLDTKDIIYTKYPPQILLGLEFIPVMQQELPTQVVLKAMIQTRVLVY
jgi:hypothetical protein